MNVHSVPLTIAFATLSSVACSGHHVRIEVAKTSTGSWFSCSVVEPAPSDGVARATCQGSGTIDPADENRAGTMFLTLPEECGAKFNPIVVHDAPTHPTVEARCAPNGDVSLLCTTDPNGAPGGASSAACERNPTVLSIQNAKGTTLVTLPTQCAGRFSRFVIHDADAKRPTFLVRCAAPEDDVPPKPASSKQP